MHSRNSSINSATVESAIRAALEVAESDGVDICVAIVDDRGHDLMVVRDKAIWFTAGAARAKAATAALLGMPTSSFAELAGEYPDLSPLIQNQVREPMTTLPGGSTTDHRWRGGWRNRSQRCNARTRCPVRPRWS